MSIVQLLLIFFTVSLLSVGQVLFKLASADINLSLFGLLPSLTSVRLLIALIVYTFATVLWLIVLKDLPLRTVYPFAALAFFIVPTLAYFILGEALSWNTYVGALIIVFGVIVSTFK